MFFVMVSQSELALVIVAADIPTEVVPEDIEAEDEEENELQLFDVSATWFCTYWKNSYLVRFNLFLSWNSHSSVITTSLVIWELSDKTALAVGES